MMSQRPSVPDLKPFSECGYDIVDDGLTSRREVAIASGDPLAPRLGDLFTVERRGVVHELAVIRTSMRRGRWSAICRVSDVF
jgi:hypothetical protein